MFMCGVCVCVSGIFVHVRTCYVELLIRLHTNTLGNHCRDWQTLTDAPPYECSAVSAENIVLLALQTNDTSDRYESPP